MVQNYNEMPISMYGKILDVLRSDLDGLDKEVALLAIVSGKSEEELVNMPLTDLRTITAKCGYLTEKPTVAEMRKEYSVGKYTLIPIKRIERITAGQFIDFQEWAKMYRERNDVEYLPQILSCFLIPKDKVYNVDYDIFEVQDAIRENLSVADAMTLLAFFLDSTQRSQRNILLYLEWRLRLTRAKTPEQKKAKKIQIAKIRELRDSL